MYLEWRAGVDEGTFFVNQEGKFTFLSAAAYENPPDAESETVSHVPLTATRSSQSAARGITV